MREAIRREAFSSNPRGVGSRGLKILFFFILIILSKVFFFLDAPGGTGKTFLLSLILAKIRSQQKIALAVASSGIAAHSALKLP